MPKQFREAAGRPLLAWTISRFQAAERIERIIVVVPEEFLLHTSERVVDPYGFDKVIKIVIGGAERQESVRRGLEALPISTKFAAIHDGARPLTRPQDIDLTVEAAARDRAAILAGPVTDTVKRVEGSFVIATLDRRRLYGAQTPQVFQYDLIMEAHRDTVKGETAYTDDASMVEARGFKVKVVEPTGPNFKVTTQDDLVLAGLILEREKRG